MAIPLRLIILITACLAGNAGAVASEFAMPDEDRATVLIQGRQFTPERTTLRHGRKARLVFSNLDSELHTFAPSGLLAVGSFNISGNGAPEFGPEGLKRVIIPPDGSAEISFTPTVPGEYRYMCDMPGHQMSALIIVE
jgi:plastocyanin